MFKLLRLEDRIVLDGAALDALQQKEQYDRHEYDLMMQASHASDHQATPDLAHADHDGDSGADHHSVDTHQPLFLADITDSGTHDAGVHVLVISSEIKDADDLAAAAKDDVLVIRYDAANTSTEELAKLIHDALGGHKADSIAFAVHSNGDYVNLHLTQTDVTTPDTLHDAKQVAFWKSVSGDLSDNGRIDLLACNLAADQTGIKFVTDLETLTGKNVAASSDLTGNAAHGGNWTLETDHVDVQKVYFDDHRIEKFDSVMASVGHGNKLIPNQSAVIGTTITTYELFPADTFTDPDGDALTYTAPSPWTATGRQLITSTGNVKFYGVTRQVYGTPSVALTVGDYPVTIYANSADGSKDSLSFTFKIGAAGNNVPVYNDPSPNTFYVDEGAGVGTVVTPPALITATDADNNLAASPYKIVWSSNNPVGAAYGTNNSPFTIDSTGQITVNGTVSYAAASQYSLILEAKDTTGLQDTARVVINVNKTNPAYQPTVSLKPFSPATFSEHLGTTTLTAEVSGTFTSPVTVNLGFTGTATDNVDYTASAHTLTFPVGVTSKTIVLTGISDTDYTEPTETIIATLTSPNATVSTSASTATASITNVDTRTLPQVNLTVVPSSFYEGQTPAPIIYAQTTQAVTSNVTVNFAWSGSASYGADYNLTPADYIVISAGSNIGQITLNPLTDGPTVDNYLDETISVSVIPSQTVMPGTASPSVLATIKDLITPTVSIVAGGATIMDELGHTLAPVYVNLDRPNPQSPVSVYLATSGDATFNTDYSAAQNLGFSIAAQTYSGGYLVTFAVGETQKMLVFKGLADGIYDGKVANEKIVLTPVNAVGAAITAATPLTLEILDADTSNMPALSMSLTKTTLGEGVSPTTLVLALNQPVATTDVQVTVGVSDKANGVAYLGGDYTVSGATATTGNTFTVTIPKGYLTAGYVLSGISDPYFELNETFTLSVNNIMHAQVGTAAGPLTATIIDDTADIPTISMAFSNATFSETSGAGNTTTLTLSLAGGGTIQSGDTKTMYLSQDATAPNFATANSDYLITAAAWNTAGYWTVDYTDTTANKSFAVNGVTDSYVEGTETVKLLGKWGQAATNGASASASASAGLIDNTVDTGLKVSIQGSGSFVEGSSTTFTLSLSQQMGSPTTVNLAYGGTANWGTATAGPATPNSASQDYMSGYTSSSVVFAAGETVKNIVLTAFTDGTGKYYEGDETLTIAIVPSPGLYTSAGVATATIVDQYSAPAVYLASAGSSLKFAEGGTTSGAAAGFAMLQAVREYPAVAATVNLSYSTDSAIYGVDYTGIKSVVIADGATAQPFQVSSITDKILEPDETIVVTAVSVTGPLPAESVGTPSSITLTIADDDLNGPAQLFVEYPGFSAATIGETVTPNTTTIKLNLDRQLNTATTVTLGIGGSATYLTTGQDYSVSVGGSLVSVGTDGKLVVTFSPGETQKALTFKALNDGVFETITETINISIGNAVASGTNTIEIADATTYTASIVPDTGDKPTISMTPANATLAEDGGTATILLTMTQGMQDPVTVSFTYDHNSITTPGQVQNPQYLNDFLFAGTYLPSFSSPNTFQVVIPPNTTQIALNVLGQSDNLYEGNEIVKLTMGSATYAGGSLSVSSTNKTANVTIMDYADMPTASLVTSGTVTMMEDSSNTTAFMISLGQTAAIDTTVTLTFQSLISPGMAILGSSGSGDYVANYGTIGMVGGANTVIIPATVTGGVFTVTAQSDTLVEGKETFLVQLQDGTGYKKDTAAFSQNYTIIDNDFTAPTVTLVDTGTDPNYGNTSKVLNEKGGFNSTGVIYVDISSAYGLSSTLVAEAKITLGGLASYINDYTVNVYENGGFSARAESVTDGIISVFFNDSTTTRAAVVLMPKLDAIYEGNESLTMGIDVTASQNLIAGSNLSSTLTVVDAQTAPRISLIASNATLSESTNDGSYPLTSTVSLNLSGPMEDTFTVGINLTPTNANYISDFVVYDTAGVSFGTLNALSTKVFTIPAGQTSVNLFKVSTVDDTLYESNQSMTAYLATVGSTYRNLVTFADYTTANITTISIAESDTAMKPYVSISLNATEGYGNGSWSSTTGIPFNFGESGGFTIGGTGGHNDGIMGIDVNLKNALSQGSTVITDVVVTLSLGPVYTAGNNIYAMAGTAGTVTQADFVVGTGGLQAAIMQDSGATTNTSDDWWKMVVTLPGGLSKGTAYLSAVNDTVFEAPELVVVSMVTASGAHPVTGAALTATLLDNDQANAPKITLGFGATSFSEGGFTQLWATLGDTNGALVDTYVKLDFTVGGSVAKWNGDVTSGGDFSISGNTLDKTTANYIKFTPGQSISYIQINGLTDGYIENTESVIASIGKVYYGLSDLTGYTMASSAGSVLVDGDGPAKVTLSTPTVGNIAEVTTGVTTGYSSTMLVNLNYSADYDITVNLSFTSGTASYGAVSGLGDFQYATSGATAASPGTWADSGATGTNGIVIPAGATAVKLWLSAYDDTRYEGNETLVVTALTGAGYTASASPAQTVTIIDNEKLTVALNPGTFAFAENGGFANLTMGLFSDTNGTVQSLYSPQTVVLQFSTDGQTSLTSGTANKASFADYQVSTDGGFNFSTVGTDGKLTLVLPTGASQQGIVVKGVDDAYFEGTEGFTVSIATSGSYNVSAGAGTVSGTVLDNDPQVYIKLAQTPANGRISEGGGLYAGWLDAYLVNSDGQAVTASVDTPLIIGFTAASNNNQAQLNVDYTAHGANTSGYITTAILTGQSATQVYLTPGEDTIYEGPEAFSAFISNRMYADVSAGDGVRTFTILDNDPGPTVSLALSPATVAEDGNPGATLSIYLSSSSPQIEYVYLNMGGKAVFGTDAATIADVTYGADYYVLDSTGNPLSTYYTDSVNGISRVMLTIPAGMTKADYQIAAADDNGPPADGTWANLYEGNETFTVSLSTYSNGGYLSNLQTGTAASVTGTIIDDDTPPRTLSLASLGTTSFAEATTDTHIFWLTFKTSNFDTNVTLSIGGNASLANDGIANTPGEDYQLRLATYGDFTTPTAITSSNGVFNFTIPSSASLTGIPIYVSMYDDKLFEGNETFTVTINPGVAYSVGTPGAFSGTIIDDDQPKISLAVYHTASPYAENSYAYDWRPEQTFASDGKVLATATDGTVHIYSNTTGVAIITGSAWNTSEAAKWSDGGVWDNTLSSNGKNFVYEMDTNSTLDGLYKITKDVATTDMVLVDWTLDFTAMNAAGFTAPADYLAGKTSGTVTLAQDAGATAVIPLNITIIGDDKAETNTSGTKLEDIAVKISNPRWFNTNNPTGFTDAQLYADYMYGGTGTSGSATSHLYVVDDDFYPGQSIGATVGMVGTSGIRFYNPLNEIGGYTVGSLGTDGLTEGGVATISTGKLYFQDVDKIVGTEPMGHQDFSGLTYTVVTAPSVGTLFVDANSNGVVDTGEALSAGSTFLQSAITSGQLKYAHGGSETVNDSFTFTVSDGTNVTYATAGPGNQATFGATAGSPFTFAITAAGANDLPTAYNKVFWINENTSGMLYKDATLGQLGSYFAFDSDDSHNATGPEYYDFALNTAAQVIGTAQSMGETASGKVTGSYIVYDPANWYKDTAGNYQPLFALETAFDSGVSASSGTKLAIKVANPAGLDYEVKSAYSVHVKVNDTATTSGQKDAWIVVKVNDLVEPDPYAINDTPLKDQTINKAALIASEQAFVYTFDSAAFPKGDAGAIVTYRYAANVGGVTSWLHFETEARTFWSLSSEVATAANGTYKITVFADYYYQQGGSATLKGTVSKDFYMTVASLELDAVMDALQYLDTDGADMLPADGDQIPVQEMMVARGNAADANAEVSEVLALLDAEAYLFDAQRA